MSKRRQLSGSLGTVNRLNFASRSFEDSIEAITNDSIEQSLVRIEKAFQERYGSKGENSEPHAPKLQTPKAPLKPE